MINEVEKYYNLNDPSKKGPRGFVFAYDDNRKLLFHQENMIVESGRKALMENGFDTGASKILKVIVGNSEELTTSDMDVKSSTDIATSGQDDYTEIVGNHYYEIKDRIIPDVVNGVDDTLNNDSYMGENEKTRIKNIVKGNLIDDFKNITIDKDTGNILFSSDTSDVMVYSRQDREINKILNISGYDESCFEICKDTSTSKLYGLCKIFIRHTDDDIENTDYTGYAKDWYSCMALFIDNPDKGGDNFLLFSRVVFPRYYKTSTNSIMFNYYIYF